MTEVTAAPSLDSDLAKRVDQNVATVDEAYEGYKELRSRCPVAHSDRNGGYYMLTRHSDVRQAALDWKNFSSAKGVGLPPDRTRPPLFALENDPPEHGLWRKRYTDAITPESLKAMEPVMERIANELIDQFAAKGTCDLAAEFCEPLPVMGISAAIGLTGKKVEEIRTLAMAMTSTVADPPAQKEALGRLAGFIVGELHERRATPREDYLTTIAQMEVDGELMSDHQLASFMIGFLVAGHETTTSALSGFLNNVLRQPELKKRVMEDDAAMAAAIEEAVRMTAPLHGFSRTTTQDVEIGGVTIPEDQVVRLCWAAANRDPDVFPDPDTFNIDRERNPHLGFGSGRHVCAGAPFARLEIRIAVRQLLSRLPDIMLTDDKVEWSFVGGMMTLPKAINARFTPAA